jgi:hypothetical protein
MNFHPVKKIMAELNVDRETAKRIRGVVKDQIDPEDESLFPKTSKWIRSCYNRPSKTALKLSALNELIGGFGVEGIGRNDNPPYTPPYEYINTGDTYAATIIRDNLRNRYFVSDWGTIVERNPKLCRE